MSADGPRLPRAGEAGSSRQRWLVTPNLRAVDEDELEAIRRRWPGLHQLFVISSSPIEASRAEMAELDAWFRGEQEAPNRLRRPPMSIASGADFDRFLDAWVSTTDRLRSGRRRAATLIRALRVRAREPRKHPDSSEEPLFEVYAHLVAALDNFGFMLWSLGSVLAPSRFRSDPHVLRSVSFKTAASQWMRVFPVAASTPVLRGVISDYRLALLLKYRNLTSHRAVAPFGATVKDQRLFDGQHFQWTIGAISAGDGLLMEMDEAASFSNWVEWTVDRVALAVALDVADRLPSIEKRAVENTIGKGDEFLDLI